METSEITAWLHPLRPWCLVPGGLEDDRDSGEKPLELVIPADVPNCPAPSFQNEDGKFHSGHLFVKVTLGYYQAKG